jgi:hypothetical protein
MRLVQLIHAGEMSKLLVEGLQVNVLRTLLPLLLPALAGGGP